MAVTPPPAVCLTAHEYIMDTLLVNSSINCASRFHGVSLVPPHTTTKRQHTLVRTCACKPTLFSVGGFFCVFLYFFFFMPDLKLRLL